MFRSVITTLGTFINKWPRLFLFLLLVLMSFAYNYHKIIELPPRSIHQWRQTDGTSFAYAYYKENRCFFEPAILNGGDDGTGRTIAEFPIIYYVVGKIWQVFGHNEMIFRLLEIIIVFAGLLALFVFCRLFLCNIFWSLIIPVLLFTSPVLVFYTNNFLPNAPAFGMVLIGWLFFGRFYFQKKTKDLVISVVVFTLAALLKISMAISYIGILAIFVLERIKLLKNTYGDLVFNKPGKHFLMLLILPFVTIPWIIYARHYNQLHSEGFFILKIMPLWQLEPVKIKEISDILFLKQIPAFMNRVIFYITLFLFVVNIVFIRKANRYLISLSILFFIGSTAYIVLFFEQFNVHDYYLLEILIFPMFVFLTSFDILRHHFSNVFNSNILKFSVVAGLIVSVYITSGINRMKYKPNDVVATNNPFLNESFIEQWQYHHWRYSITLKALETITPYLRSLGIQYNDLVLSYPDNSYNISLYLMKQKGYGVRLARELPEDKRMQKILNQNVKYFIIYDPIVYEWDFVQPYIDYKIGEYKNVDIYDLRPYKSR